MVFAARETLKSSDAGSSLRSGWRVFVLCLSFANLCFLRTWSEIQDDPDAFFNRSPPTWAHLAAALLDVLILAVILWVPVMLVVRSRKPVWIRSLKWCILAGFMAPLNTIRLDSDVVRLSGEILDVRYGRLALGIAGFALGAFMLVRWERLSARVTSVVLTVLLPVLPLTVAASAWHLSRRTYSSPSGTLAGRPLLPALPQKPGAPHVLWILFDEWDQTLTFDARTENLQLPELARFRAESFYAGHAYPPGAHTIVSIPSLLSGKTFSKSTRQGMSEILETYDPRQPDERLSAESTIFTEARSAGFNVGLVGWYLPYCRLFGNLTSCPGAEPHEDRPSLPGLMWNAVREQIQALPLLGRLGITQRPPTSQESHLQIYRQQLSEAIPAVRDRRLNFVFFHICVPHWPPIYDAAKASFSTSPGGTYLDSLALVDRTLGEIRQTLEQARTWDSTTILLTSDHPLRVELWRSMHHVGLPANAQQLPRVPFLLKMAGEKQGVDYPRVIQTVVTKDLLLAILNGKVTTAEQVGVWLDSHPPRQ
jgi:hypothetical protein